LEDPTQQAYLIDYEFTGWQPRAMDLANYINECLIDNAHPGHPSGIGFFPHNLMTQDEVRYLVKSYLVHVH
jgi:thiamine kinase-like enzyme